MCCNQRIVLQSVKQQILSDMTRLDYDMDNFSGRWSRGTRYDILVDGSPYYRDVCEEVVDRLARELEEKGYVNVEVVEL